MPAKRLPEPLAGSAARGRPVTFTFDGKTMSGFEGEPLAVSLLAGGHPIVSRSFRLHRPRGLMCSTGQCGWCECEVDGQPSVRSCRVPVRDGLVARGEHAVPSVRRDLLGLIDLGSRWLPPTFYHHRFLSPRFLRKRYLDVIRWFGGRGRLGPLGAGTSPVAAPAAHDAPIETDVLVVGGGPAGILAAIGAGEAGARVVLVEAEAELGSIWRLRPPSDGVDLPALVARLTELGVRTMTSTAAVGWYDGMVAALGPAGSLVIHARTVVAATGSYERLPLVQGNDRPGVLGARTIEWLIRAHGVVPGSRAALVGSAETLAPAEAALAEGGASSFGPIAAGALRRIIGRRAVTGIVYNSDGQEHSTGVDLVVIGDRTPNLDLPIAAGAATELRDGTLSVVAGSSGATSVASLFVSGATGGWPLHRPGAADAARAAGAAAAAQAQHPQAGPAGTPSPVRKAPDEPDARPLIDAAATLCFCEDVRVGELYAERASGFHHPEFVKRRTGALTGPCQGKYCLQGFANATAADPLKPGDALPLPTARPPLRPVRLGDLADADPATARATAVPSTARDRP